MADQYNKCTYGLVSDLSINESFTHQAVIVGWGRQSIYDYSLVKQSWGDKFGN